MDEQDIKDKLNKQVESINWDGAMSCPICREWIILSSRQFSTAEEVKYKENYWDEYSAKLKAQGFINDTNS